jgi:3-keto-L-gulonate-6-phosphate decarboxylase
MEEPYYTKAETDTAHQEIVDNMTVQLIEMRKSLDANLNEKVSALATTEDIKELKQFMKNLKIGLGVFEFSWNNSAKIGSIILFIIGVFIFFKVGIAGVIAAFFSPK